MIQRVPTPTRVRGADFRRGAPARGRLLLTIATVFPGVLTLTACTQHDRAVTPRPAPATRVVAVAPVINLSNTAGFDALVLTDMLAAELTNIDGLAVIAPNRARAVLLQHGKTSVETAEDALALADELHADATIVAAITAYDPYEPPKLGLVLQWYAQPRSQAARLDPVAASRLASEITLPEAAAPAPGVQIQRFYDAADEDLLDDIQDYGQDREGHRSPYAWRRYVVSQELFVRYCIGNAIRTMLTQERLARESQLAERSSDGR